MSQAGVLYSMYLKYIDKTDNELTYCKVYHVLSIKALGTLESVTIINDLDIEQSYLYDENFMEVTQEYVRNETITGILT